MYFMYFVLLTLKHTSMFFTFLSNKWMRRFCCDTYCETKAIYINITVNNEFLDCNSVIVFLNHDIDDINVHLS